MQGDTPSHFVSSSKSHSTQLVLRDLPWWQNQKEKWVLITKVRQPK